MNTDTAESADDKRAFTENLQNALIDPAIRASFADIMKESINDEIKSATRVLDTKLDTISTALDETRLTCAENCTSMDTKYTAMERRLLFLERDSNKKLLRVVGLMLPSESDDDGNSITLEDKKNHMIDNFIQLCDSCDVDIHNDDIVSSSLVKTPGSNTMETLIIKLRSEHCKRYLYSKRTNFRKCTQRIYLNECLTKRDANIFRKSRNDVKAGKLHSSWTVGGKVYARASQNGNVFCLSDED